MSEQRIPTATYRFHTRPAWRWRQLLLLLTLLLSLTTAKLAMAVQGNDNYLVPLASGLTVAAIGTYLLRSRSLRKTLVLYNDGVIAIHARGRRRIELSSQKLIELQAPDLNDAQVNKLGLMFECKRIRFSTPPLARRSRKAQLYADYQHALHHLVPLLGLQQKPNRASKRIYCYYNPAYLDSIKGIKKHVS